MIGATIQHWRDEAGDAVHTRMSGPGADDLYFTTPYVDVIVMSHCDLLAYLNRRALIVAAARYSDSGD